MNTIYSPDLKAHLTMDKEERVRHILHTQEYFLSEKSNARTASVDYLYEMAETFRIPPSQLKNLHQRTSFLDPREQDIEYRLYDIKKFFASTTFCYYQTIHNVPVWHGGMTVTVKENPYRIIHADNYGHDDLRVELPPGEIIEKSRDALLRINSVARNKQLTVEEEEKTIEPPAVTFKSAFAVPRRTAATRGRAQTPAQTPSWYNQIKITRGFFYIYRYDEKERQPKNADIVLRGANKGTTYDLETGDNEPTLPLPPVPARIKDGQHYLVAEIVFHLGSRVKDRLNWKALVEIETGSILWLRAMIAGVTNGLVFTYDPKTSTGILANTPDSTNAVLNPMRDPVELLNLDAPVMGTQSLVGSNVRLADDDSPTVAAPTKPTGTNFDYDARTNDFAAVNAYYHTNNVFLVIEDLGFNLATYFDGTTFPVHVDHRASSSDTPGDAGIEVNAFCKGDGPTGYTGDGIGLVGFCLSDDTGVADTTTNPLGRAVDKWVHWHELGGHGILWDHVNSANFGFAHSAGDTLAAFQNDPESLLRMLPERFKYAPFRDWPVGSDRWFNRTVASGWGWGGTQDGGGYLTEQIIATTLFRVYQALGGDSDDVNKRWHASRVATYLVLNAVGKLMPGTNPSTPEGLYNKLVEADADDWTSEGLAGGAYNKVLRWSFEKQGLWQSPGSPVPTTLPGAPPAVDLYINDGRNGEYQYQAVHWNNPSVWNRTMADGGTTQDPGVAGVPSFAYVKVKNRGTTNASGIVKVYHCKPGAGLTWPTDFDQATPLDGRATGMVLANNANEVIVGPFNWTPNVNMFGHDCLLAIVTADGDPSNVSNLEPGQTIQEWRLVPHDNNVGQRNVNLVPGGGGGEALMAALDGVVFFAGNNFNKAANMELKVEVPRVLAAKGWQLQFAGLSSNQFKLKAGEKRRIELKLSKGAEFTADEVRGLAERNFNVYLYGNGMLMGGMTYHVDPDMTKPPHGRDRPGTECRDAAQSLLDCLKLSGEKVKKVCVKKVSVDIELDNDCGCD